MKEQGDIQVIMKGAGILLELETLVTSILYICYVGLANSTIKGFLIGSLIAKPAIILFYTQIVRTI